MSDNGTTVGIDSNQLSKTTYSEDLSDEGSQSSEVYVTQASTFGVLIPKTIILSGDTGKGAYVVKAQGNIGGEETLNVIPNDSLLLTQAGKQDITATIVQDKSSWKWNEFDTLGNGEISAMLSAGSWGGSFNFNIYVSFFDKNTITYNLDGGILPDNKTNPNSFEDFNGVDTIILNNPIKEGYVFNGWVGSNSVEPQTIVKVSNLEKKDLTFTATWINNDQAIAYIGNDGTTLTWSELLSQTELNIIENGKLTSDNGMGVSTSSRTKLKKLNGTIILNDNVKEIDNCTFLSCSNLTISNIPNSVVSIGEYALCSTKTNNIFIPQNVISIGAGAFSKFNFVYNGTATGSPWGGIHHKDSTITYNMNGGKFTNETQVPTSFNITTNKFSISIPSKEGYIFWGWRLDSKHPAYTYYPSKNIEIYALNTNYLSKSYPQVSTAGLSYEKQSYSLDKNTNVILNAVWIDPKDGYYTNDDNIILDWNSFLLLTSMYVKDGVLYHTSSPTENKKLQGLFGKIVLPNNDTITGLSTYTFMDCKDIYSIILPDSLEQIGNGAFYNCSSLKDIIIPQSVTSLGEFVFINCSSLTTARIPNQNSIGMSLFSNCTSLYSITIPDSVLAIKSAAFNNCTSLTELRIPNSVNSIGDSAFNNVKHIYYYGSNTNSVYKAPWGALAMN